MVVWETIVFILFLSDTPALIMLLNGKAFEGTVNYIVTDEYMQSVTSNSHTTCITSFKPVEFSHARMVYKLLLVLCNYDLCCFLSGTYALFVA